MEDARCTMVGRLWSLGVFYILIIALTVSSDGREDNARGRNQGKKVKEKMPFQDKLTLVFQLKEVC